VDTRPCKVVRTSVASMLPGNDVIHVKRKRMKRRRQMAILAAIPARARTNRTIQGSPVLILIQSSTGLGLHDGQQVTRSRSSKRKARRYRAASGERSFSRDRMSLARIADSVSRGKGCGRMLFRFDFNSAEYFSGRPIAFSGREQGLTLWAPVRRCPPRGQAWHVSVFPGGVRDA
jgi:hypothetical protein